MSHTPDWTASMSPNPYQHPNHGVIPAVQNVSTESGVTIKSMRLKVLYTFDEQSKVNCLARWPHVLQVKTVLLDDTTNIGVVDLKTCVQAIAQCSPELIGNLGNDYAIYAFDYSEYDQPLVGQGMLSWALAAPSLPANSATNDMDKLVTGRVCNNIQGLFSNGVRETLEVKFRLIPVPTWSQTNFMPDLDHRTSMSSQTIQHNSMAPGSSLEVMNQLLSPNPSQHNLDPFNNPVGNQEIVDVSTVPATKTSRPSSRASMKRSRKTRTKEAIGGDTSGYEEGTDNDDVLPSKKRAKVVQADWTGKSTFGTSAESLRVAASTTNSIRSFRPILSGTSVPPGNHLQDVPRAPTPVPSLPRKPMRRDSARRNSNLSQAPPLRVLSPYPVHPLQEQNIQASIEMVMSSPEKVDSAGESPLDIASSPPVMRSLARHSSPREAQSSPELPPMPRTDSGFMSGGPSEALEVEECVVEPTLPKLKPQSRRGRPRNNEHVGFPFEQVVPGPPELLPTKMFTIDPKRQEVQTLRAYRRADSIASDDGTLFSRNAEPRAPTPATNGRKPRIRQQLPAVPRPLQVLAPAPGPGLVKLPIAIPVSTLAPAPVQISAPAPLPAPVVASAPAARKPLPLAQRETITTSTSQPIPPRPTQPLATHQAQTSLPEPVTSSNTEDMIDPALRTVTNKGPSPTLQPVVEEQATDDQARPSTAASQQSFQEPLSRPLSRTASAGGLTLPATSLPTITQPTTLNRSQTWSQGPSISCEPEVETTKVKTAVAKKTSIRLRLESAMAEGRIPPYCHNCGAIDTPTWRKCMIKTMQGEPGYHEYSDAPGKVIAISVLTKDEEGKPTSYQLYKKTLAQGEDKSEFEEIQLCNPCGIWLSKFKSHRPEDKWNKEIKPRKKTAEPRKRGKKARRDSEAPATSDWFQSDAATPGENDGLADWVGEPPPVAITTDDRQRAASVKPAPRTSTMPNTGTSALRRAIQSSPAGRGSSHHSPIEIDDEDMGTTKRLLFPSPRRDGVMKVLGHSESNSVQPIAQFSPTSRADASANTVENVLHVKKVRVEESSERSRNTTPPPRITTNVFKTPTRPTPSHRPVTRSVSKSDRERQDTVHMTPTKTPTTVRRSPRHARAPTESPFTASMNKLMSEVNNASPSRSFGMNLDFSLPELGSSILPNSFLNIHNFDPNQDFFSTDVPMPSSPPRFDLYDASMDIPGMVMDHSDIWNDFQDHQDEASQAGVGTDLGQFLVDANGQASFEMGRQIIKAEPGTEAAGGLE